MGAGPRQKSSWPGKNNLTDQKQAVYFTLVNVQIMRCNCDWTTHCVQVPEAEVIFLVKSFYDITYLSLIFNMWA